MRASRCRCRWAWIACAAVVAAAIASCGGTSHDRDGGPDGMTRDAGAEGGAPEGGATPDGGGTGDAGGPGDASTGDPCATGPSEPPFPCPTGAPPPDDRRGACCYRVARDCDSLPSLRFASLREAPDAGAASVLLALLLRGGMDLEDTNWLLQADALDAGGRLRLTAGMGRRNADGTFSFGAPAGGDPTQWQARSGSGSLVSEVLRSDPFAEPVRLASLDGFSIMTEVPLDALQIDMAALSEARSCVGRRVRGGWETDAGRLTGYLRVDARVIVPPVLGDELCAYLAGLADRGPCETVPRAEWPNPPDALCDADGCRPAGAGGDVCDRATTCNAWRLHLEFAAQGVRIR